MRVIAGRFKGLELKAPKSGTRPTTDRTKEAIFSRLESWGMLDDARVLDLFAGTGALGVEALSRGARELVAVESASAAASLIAATFSAMRRQHAWTSDMRATVVRKRAEQYVLSYLCGGGGGVADGGAAGGSDAGGSVVSGGATGGGVARAVKTRSAAEPTTSIGDARCAASSVGGMETIAGGGAAAGSSVAGGNAVFDVIFIDPPYAFATEECNTLLDNLVASGLAGERTVVVLERSVRSDDPTPPEGWCIADWRNYGETAVFYLETA